MRGHLIRCIDVSDEPDASVMWIYISQITWNHIPEDRNLNVFSCFTLPAYVDSREKCTKYQTSLLQTRGVIFN
jgi:hypothetical protein